MRIAAVLVLSLFAFSCGEQAEDAPAESPAAPAHVDFEFTDESNTFNIRLTDPARIAHARRILSGEETAEVHVSGLIVKEPADYNAPWSYHLEPSSIEFFEISIEVCDASIQYVEDHLGEIGGSTLPGNAWCPWSSRLTRELP